MSNNEQTNSGDPVVNIPATLNEVQALIACIETAKKEYSIKGSKNKKGAIIVQVLLIVLSALTTIFIGWKSANNNINLTNLALICSAIVASLNVIIAFFDYKELWVQYKVSRNDLTMLRAELNFISASEDGKVTKKQLLVIFEEYKNICNRTNQAYQQLRMAKDSVDK